MSLKRILKLLAAFLTGQGVALATQLIIPPLFLHRYVHGVEMYGEWVALTASVAYLSTLNYGIQNYANNQMAIHYTRGELDQAKAVQANALRLVLIVVALLSTLGVTFLWMPVGRWLGLRYIGSFAASLTMFLMLLQLVVSMLFALLANSYMTVGQAHRGQNWVNAQRLGAVLAIAGFIWERASFPVLAAAQLASVIVFTLLVLFDVYIKAPVLFPSLGYGSLRQSISVLKPSAYFGLFSVSVFLTWQGPLLVLEKLSGPTSVAIFALSRTVFSMNRLILSVASYALGQDITHLVGQRNWLQLRRLYELSEKVVLFLIPAVTIGTLLVCPLLFTVWLRNRSIYQPTICMLMAAISCAIGIKDHKIQFQWSSNEHESLARFTMAASISMLILSAFLLKLFGIEAFLSAWLASEVIVTVYVVYLNRKLFPADIHIDVEPMWRLLGVLIISFALAVWPAWHDATWHLWKVACVAVFVSAVLGSISYASFGVDEVRAVVGAKLRRHQAASTQ